MAGVNDQNLLELQRATGVRASIRGDNISLSGTLEQVERATPVVQAMVAVQDRRAGRTGT